MSEPSYASDNNKVSYAAGTGTVFMMYPSPLQYSTMRGNVYTLNKIYKVQSCYLQAKASPPCYFRSY